MGSLRAFPEGTSSTGRVDELPSYSERAVGITDTCDVCKRDQSAALATRTSRIQIALSFLPSPTKLNNIKLKREKIGSCHASHIT